MKPHLVKWAENYASKGLVIIDVDNGGMDTKDALARAAEKLPYRVLWDEDGRVCKEYGIRGYPAAYLIDVEGNVVWEGFPLPNVGAIEETIRREIERVAEEKRGDPSPDDWKKAEEKQDDGK